MAVLKCEDCGFVGGFSEFRQHMTDEQIEAEYLQSDSDDYEGDSIECPVCGSPSAYEL